MYDYIEASFTPQARYGFDRFSPPVDYRSGFRQKLGPSSAGTARGTGAVLNEQTGVAKKTGAPGAAGPGQAALTTSAPRHLPLSP